MAWACLQVYQLLRAGQSAPQDQATGWWQVGKLRGCDNYFRVLRCLVVDVRSADRASGHIQALQPCFAQGPLGCPVSRSLQGSVHEPTSFQAPLLNRAGPPRKGAGALGRKSRPPHRLHVRCRSWCRSFRRRSWSPAAENPAFRLLYHVVLPVSDCAMSTPCAKLLRFSTASILCIAAHSGMPSLL